MDANGYGFSQKQSSGTATELITYVDSGASPFGSIGMYTNHPLRILSNNTTSMTVSTASVSIGATVGVQALNVLGASGKSIRLGKAESNNNCFTWTYNEVGAGDPLNNVSLQAYGVSNNFTVNGQGWASLGGALGAKAALEINGSQTFSFAGADIYNVNANTYSSVGAGSAGMAIWCDSNIWCNESVYCSSDRRIKRNIEDFSIGIDDYMRIKPRKFTRKDSKRDEIGVIAQEIYHILPRLVTLVPTELKQEEIDDPTQGQMVFQYDKLAVVNTHIIQQLIKEIDGLKNCNDELANMIHELRELRNKSL
jgi:hypothetical protein